MKKGLDAIQIKNAMQKEFRQDVSYWKAWKAKEEAQNMIRGTPEGNYEMLPSYFHIMQQVNPGTYACLEIDGYSRFKYAFLSFGASIQGFQAMRKVRTI